MLSQEQVRVLKEEKRLLHELLQQLTTCETSAEDMAVLQRALLDLDELFLLVIVGEFNSGKSAFVNALVGEKVLPEGVTPTTAAVTRLRYGPTRAQVVTAEGLLEIGHPAEFLRDLSVVDTPGTNAVIRKHEEVSRRFVPRSDLILFVTSVDRPFTESERAFLEHIREWGKKVVIVLNKIDLLEGEDDVGKVEEFVAQNVQTLLGFTPEIFPVSAKLAFRAKSAGPPDERQQLWQASHFAALEGFVLQALDEASRIRLKLLNPLGVAQKIVREHTENVEQRLALLREDFRTIEDIDDQLGIYSADMKRDFAYHLSHIENIIHEMNARGLRFFEETLRLARVFDLFRSERIRNEFAQTVVADAPQEIEGSVQSLIDWMVDQDMRTWQAVMDFLDRRRATRDDKHMVGKVGSAYEYNRRELLQSVGRTAHQVVEDYDREAEARQLADSVRLAVTQATLAEVGAVGIGTVLAILIGTAAADVTGILAASVIAGLGLLIIPAKKRRAQMEFQQKTDHLREKLVAAMRQQFGLELDRSLKRIREAIAPYTRLVRAEHDKVTRLKEGLAQVDEGLSKLRMEIDLL